MIVVNPREPLPFKPDGSETTYMVRPPRVDDRAKFRQASAKAGARLWSQLEFARLGKQAAQKVLSEESQKEELAGAIELFDVYSENIKAAIKEVQSENSEENRKAFTEALKVPEVMEKMLLLLSDHDEELASAIADNSVYWLILGQTSARMFLVGWDKEEPFKRTLAGPTEETLARITDLEFEQLAGFCQDLLRPPAKDVMGNSNSPSSTQQNQEPSGEQTNTPQSLH